MSEYCPFCGAVIPRDAEECPQCREPVPLEERRNEAYHLSHRCSPDEYRAMISKRKKSYSAVRLLGTVPLLAGLAGIAQIYRDRRDTKGWTMLVIGLVLFWSAIGLLCTGLGTSGLPGILLMVSAIVPAVLYLSFAAASAVDALQGSLGFFGSKF